MSEKEKIIEEMETIIHALEAPETSMKEQIKAKRKAADIIRTVIKELRGEV